MKKYFLFFILSLSIYVAHAIYTKHAIYGDGNGYYATAQSILYDHTLNSPRVLDHLKNFRGKDYVFSRVFWDENQSPYSVGTSLTWIPSLIISSVFSSDPLDLFHEISVGISGILMILLGLFFLEKYLLNFYSHQVVLVTIISLYLGSSIFYYSSFEPALSHQPAFLLISFLLYWTHDLKLSNIKVFIFGLLIGFLPSIRIVDVILIFPILLIIKLELKNIPSLLIGVMIGYLPQIGTQYYYFGSILKNFYVTESVSQWSFNIYRIFEYLFSLKRGLFVWSPIYLFGVFGLIRKREVSIIISVIALWLIGSFWSGYLSAGFGQRLSFSAIPYFGVGIAYLYDLLEQKKILFMTILFMTWNLYLLYGFYILGWKNFS